MQRTIFFLELIWFVGFVILAIIARVEGSRLETSILAIHVTSIALFIPLFHFKCGTFYSLIYAVQVTREALLIDFFLRQGLSPFYVGVLTLILLSYQLLLSFFGLLLSLAMIFALDSK